MTKLKIRGMSCDHCRASVKSALEQVAGVEQVVNIDLQTGTAGVAGSPVISDLIAALADQGYQAEVIE